MKKRIIALLCGGATAAMSCTCFAGCDGGHKHNYKDSYVLATCTDAGYTLHSCTDCDYEYADEFVKPYNHAYEHCVSLAVPVEDAQSLADQSSRAASSAPIKVDGLPESIPIGSPLCEISASQTEIMNRCFSNILNKHYEQVDPSKEYSSIVFSRSECPFCGDRNEKAFSITVPILATVPIPNLDISGAEINATFDISTENGGSGAFDGDIHDHGFEPRTVSAAASDPALFASVPTNYIYSNGSLTVGTKATAANLQKGGDGQPLQMTMASTIEEIEKDAFVSCTELRRVELPAALKKIGANAFGASKLDYLIMPLGLKSVGTNAFGDCANMKYLFHSGTEADWNGIAFENADDPIKSVPRYYYSEQKPTSSGNYWHYVDNEPTVW